MMYFNVNFVDLLRILRIKEFSSEKLFILKKVTSPFYRPFIYGSFINDVVVLRGMSQSRICDEKLDDRAVGSVSELVYNSGFIYGRSQVTYIAYRSQKSMILDVAS
jgi:hypothetical protein